MLSSLGHPESDFIHKASYRGQEPIRGSRWYWRYLYLFVILRTGDLKDSSEKLQARHDELFALLKRNLFPDEEFFQIRDLHNSEATNIKDSLKFAKGSNAIWTRLKTTSPSKA